MARCDTEPLRLIVLVYNDGRNFRGLSTAITVHIGAPFQVIVVYDLYVDDTIPGMQRLHLAQGFQVIPKRWVIERSHLYYPYPDNGRLSYAWPDRLIASRHRCGHVPAPGRGRARARRSTTVVPPRS